MGMFKDHGNLSCWLMVHIMISKHSIKYTALKISTWKTHCTSILLQKAGQSWIGNVSIHFYGFEQRKVQHCATSKYCVESNANIIVFFHIDQTPCWPTLIDWHVCSEWQRGNQLFEETNCFRWERNALGLERNSEQNSLMWDRTILIENGKVQMM